MITDAHQKQQRRLPRPQRALRYGVLGVLVLFVLTALRLVLLPKIDQPRPVDAIFMLEGAGDRRAKAFELARSGIAPVLVVSIPGRFRCPDKAEVGADVEIICFRPEPSTTQGEAREAGRLAELHGWHSMLFVTDRSQDTRARLRIGRCYDGEVLVAVTETPWRQWPYLIAYQSAATVKASVWQRGC